MKIIKANMLIEDNFLTLYVNMLLGKIIEKVDYRGMKLNTNHYQRIVIENRKHF